MRVLSKGKYQELHGSEGVAPPPKDRVGVSGGQREIGRYACPSGSYGRLKRVVVEELEPVAVADAGEADAPLRQRPGFEQHVGLRRREVSGAAERRIACSARRQRDEQRASGAVGVRFERAEEPAE